jgi:hypothetical protein
MLYSISVGRFGEVWNGCVKLRRWFYTKDSLTICVALTEEHRTTSIFVGLRLRRAAVESRISRRVWPNRTED